ncbi:MAG: hypothetical protein KUG69_01070 [Marinosulfonomonas sp.]|nr:hypothetical protein [Marinosulfonomonas sp.]
MRRLFCLFMLVASSANGQAVSTIVLSGEHADFSRIVLQLDTSPEWEFGRVAGGYELRFSVDAELNLSQVFDRIPRTRISALSQTGPNTLFFEVDCDCAGDAFEIRAGRLVVDIKSGQSDPNSQFERQLPTLFAERNTAQIPASGGLKFGSEISQVAPQTDFGNLGSQADQPFISVLESGSTHPNTLPKIGARSEVADEIEIATVSVAAHGEPKPPEESTKSVENSTRAADLFPSFGTFNIMPDAMGTIPSTRFLDDPLNQRVNQAQSALLSGLLRAASQGLVVVDPPQLAPLPNIGAENGRPSDGLKLESEPPAKPVELLPYKNAHLRIETAVDRSAIQTIEPTVLSHDGDICLPNDYFDVRNWGEAGQVAHTLESLRASLIGEFDNPEPVAIEQLARRYIFMGFGAEANAVLKTFGTGSKPEQILSELASILDEYQVAAPSIVRAQVSCATSASMWAILAMDKIPKGNVHDVKAILRTFSGLPVHLRQHLGPRVATRFLAAEDVEAAKAIRDLVDRAPATDGPRFNLTEARIAAKSGNVGQSIHSWNLVVDADSPHSAVALVEMIDATLENGQPVSENVARSADALAVEYRGLELGGQLMRASIRAFATNGNIKTTFERIDSAIRTGDMLTKEADSLRAEAHLRNTSISSDGEFLEIVFENKISSFDQSAATIAARIAIARRLVELGFVNTAQMTVAPIAGIRNDEHKLLLADIAFADGQLASAMDQLDGLQNVPADKLRARILEQSGDLRNAVGLYQKFDDAAARNSAAWRSADWNQISNLEIPGKSAAAKLALASVSQPQLLDVGIGAEPIDSARNEAVAQGRSILESSRGTQNILKEMLAAKSVY